MREPRSITVVLAEDHAVVREGTRQMLECDARISVVGEAADGQTAIDLVRSLAPDVLLLDMTLPGRNGVDVTRAVRSMPNGVRVLILSAHDDVGYVNDALAAGAAGYLLKTASSDVVVSAIAAVAADEIVLDPVVARVAFSVAAGGDDGPILTEREVDILRLAATGKRTKEIAAELSLSSRTVESHLTSIFNKLGVESRLEAIVAAVGLGILSALR